MSLRDLLRRRRNVYGFLSKPVTNRILNSILENATHVPSAGFTQDFEFVVVRDASLKKKLAEAASERDYSKSGRAKPDFISKAPVIVIPCGSKLRFEMKYGRPAEKKARLPWWLIDAGFASFALILSAFEVGLAASFIGAIDDEKVSKILKLPKDNSIVPLAIVPIGYPDPEEAEKWKAANLSANKKRRRKLEELTHWDGW